MAPAPEPSFVNLIFYTIRRGGRFAWRRWPADTNFLRGRQFASWLRRLGHLPPESGCRRPALETLAVVAYRQPVLKADIEAIRGVQCGEMLRQLMERDLVRIGGRSEELGRPYLYTTTKSFYNNSACEIWKVFPRAEILRAVGCHP